MYERSAISHLAILSVLLVLLAFNGTKAFAQQSESITGGPEYRISDLKAGFENDTLSITLVGDSIPAYTVSERFAPFRVIVDIAGAKPTGSLSHLSGSIPANPVATMSVYALPDEQQPITRFELTIADTHDYKVTRDGNAIGIIIAPASDIAKSPKLTPTTPAITDFKVETHPDETSIFLNGTGDFTDYQIGTLKAGANRPAQLFIDIPNVSISELVREVKIGTAVQSVKTVPHKDGARILLDSSTPELFAYDVQSTRQGINIRVQENIGDLPANVKTVAAAKSDTITDSTLDELIESSSSLLAKDKKQPAAPASDSVTEMQDNFAFSGYKNERISVDFYKIDIHNVFRLFRQITNLNIIVDEDVKGTLTLALSDVPWDFALDIILNLQDLEKVERYNTIVIYPKKKEFVWPERAMDNLSFEADVEVAQQAQQESLIIEQSSDVPQEVMQAKDLLRQATILEKSNKLEEAATLYEQAITLWPTNGAICNRLATLYLVKLNNNAKAIYFAKKGLKADPKNHSSALYAAIGSANMQKNKDATEFFTQAISGNPPMKEALFSFAAFSENTSQYATALKLIDKYHQYHGENVDTMLAKARIYDKMGDADKAAKQYQAIMASGFQLSGDLRDYIAGRVAGGR